jgi:signal transduction histidine kinase
LALVNKQLNRLGDRLTRHRRWVVLAMLLSLHAALLSTPGGDFQRVWLLVHFGFFLLWQPFIAADREIDVVGGVLLFAITLFTISFLAGWMIVGWLLLLLGILGGRVFTVQAERRGRFYLVAFTYVIAILVLRAVPALLLPTEDVPPPIALFAASVLPFMLALLAFLPLGGRTDEGTQVFDFFYAVLVFQLGLVVVLGSVATMRYTADHYFAAVALTLLGFGAALFVLAVLWNPVRGYGGLRTYFSRYLLSVGMPFELWMRRIAELAETESDSRRFLELALAEVAAFPWVKGGSWSSSEGGGRFGSSEGHAAAFSFHGLDLTFNTEIRLSPALFLHMRLLAQVVGEFYEGKRREQALRRNSYLQAVHETGARLTHDVKNLLQSLYALTSIAPRQGDAAYAALMQKQLPQLSKRLHATLEKLRSPAVETVELPVSARAWWSEAQRRLADSGLRLDSAIDSDREIPGALFDGFIENTIENARAKALREPGISIEVTFLCNVLDVSATVCDTGSAVPPHVAPRLLQEPVERGTGLGIGLFNAARMARQAGYRMELTTNRDGRVCFTLGLDSESGGED